MDLIPFIPYGLLIVGTGASCLGVAGFVQLWWDARAKRRALSRFAFNTGGGTGC